MKHSYSVVGGLVSQAFATARTQKHVARPLRKEPKFSRPVIERPIRSLGRLFGDLDGFDRRQCLRLHRYGSTLSRVVLEDEYYEMEKRASVNRKERHKSEGLGRN
jgi:hypothetical protein